MIRRSVIFSAAFLALGSLPAAERWGVLVMAHGGGPAWNDTVRRTVRNAALDAPVEIFFGMAASDGEREALAGALLSLRQRGADRVLAVPLLVSSHSEVYRQYEYMLGLRPEPGFSEQDVRGMGAQGGHAHHAGPPGAWPPPPAADHASLPVFLTRALDDSPELLAALRTRAKALIPSPAGHSLLLVAHGPNGERENRLWLKTLRRLAAGLEADPGFKDVRVLTLRDDAPPAVKERATAELRRAVQGRARGGTPALVAPVLISAGGIEQGIRDRMSGLEYRLAEPLGDHPAISAWIARKVAESTVR